MFAIPLPLLIIFAFAFAILLHSPLALADQCSTADSCSSCSLRSALSCAWCQATSECVSAASDCPSDSRLLSASTDPAICNTFCKQLSFDCGSCVSSLDCGYCSGSNVCFVGNQFGPSILELNSTLKCQSPPNSWKFNSYECPRYGLLFVGSDYNSDSDKVSLKPLEKFSLAALILILIVLPAILLLTSRSARSLVRSPFPVSLSEFWQKMFSSSGNQWRFLSIHLMSLSLIIAALLIDSWSVSHREIRVSSSDRRSFDAEFGLLTQSVGSSDSSFYPNCDWDSATQNSNNVQRCKIFKAGAIGCCICAIIGFILLILIVVLSAFSPRWCFPAGFNQFPSSPSASSSSTPISSSNSPSSPFPPLIPVLFRFYFIFYTAGVLLWATAAHPIIILYFARYSDITLSVSWYLSLAAVIVSIPLLVVWNKYSIWFSLAHHKIAEAQSTRENFDEIKSEIEIDRVSSLNSFKTERLAEEFNELNHLDSVKTSEPTSPKLSVMLNSDSDFSHENTQTNNDFGSGSENAGEIELSNHEDSEQAGILKGNISSDAETN